MMHLAKVVLSGLVCLCGVCHAAALGATPDTWAFSRPAMYLEPDDRLDFEVGRGLFRRLWVTGPASTE
ncbi:MAG TPA: hypothetical protein PLY75_02570, partial [Gammaproteobacteria bacterium]|nr:hypothetical protein [Gammaproteobacteria bacterium]